MGTTDFTPTTHDLVPTPHDPRLLVTPCKEPVNEWTILGLVKRGAGERKLAVVMRTTKTLPQIS